MADMIRQGDRVYFQRQVEGNVAALIAVVLVPTMAPGGCTYVSDLCTRQL